MTDQPLLIHHRKIMIRVRLMQSLSIPKLWRQFHVILTTFYKWFNRFLEGGELTLTNKTRSPGKQPSQIPKEIEKAILDFSQKYPAAGSKRISDELRQEGILVGKTVVYNALKHHKLNHKNYRHLRIQDPNIIEMNTY